MLIVQSEKLGMLLATNTDTENGELAEINFTRKNFGNLPNHASNNCIE